jgi:hypothetical protein
MSPPGRPKGDRPAAQREGSPVSASFTVHAGARAAAHVRSEGLKPADVACIPAAAGGPKGLALIPLDQRLPYHALEGIVLYPHFVPYVTPGWLDKRLPWRKQPRAQPWLDNVLLVAPSREFLARLPGGRLPERQDFHRYGLDHAARMRAWRRAIGECGRFADEVMAWIERPDPTRLAPL